MNPERTIKISRKTEDGNIEQVEVKMLYCAATETGFQTMSGKLIDVFIPEVGKDADGNVIITKQPEATDKDYILLALSAIVAAYERDKQEPPINSDDILFTASRAEVIELVKAVIEMRHEWLMVPSTIAPEMDDKGKAKPKNVQTPTRRSKRS